MALFGQLASSVARLPQTYGLATDIDGSYDLVDEAIAAYDRRDIRSPSA
jgi:hypothetical protein